MISLHCTTNERFMVNSGSDTVFQVRLKVRVRGQITFGTARTKEIVLLLGTA